jgi:hypothetical protein
VITVKVDDVMSANGYVVRYDNDPRDTPTVDFWCHVSLAYGTSDQVELGVPLYRHLGVLTIQIVSPIGVGVGECLRRADIIAAAFRSLTLSSNIKFRTPRIENVGRIGDNWDVNVICQFHSDEN